MFWGLVLEPSKSYAQVVDTPFHVSMAALDLKNSDNQEEASTLILRQDNTEYVLANLSKKHKIFNMTLGLDFDVGEEIEFFVQGQSQIHLTGFLAGDDNDDDLDDFNEEEDENDIEEKLKDIRKAEAAKRKLKENSSGPNKKQKILDESFNDDTDEDDFDIDEDDLDDLEDEEDSDDSEVDEDEDDSDEEMDDDEVPSPPKKKQQIQVQQQKQGAQSPESKKQKKKQKQQQQQQQQGKQGNQQQKNQANNKSPQKNQQQPNKTPQKTPQQQKNNQSKTPTNNKQQNAKSPAQGNGDAQQAKRPAKKILKGGIVVEDIAEGKGKVAASNKTVGVYYVGRLCNNRKEFDKTTGGKPFNFKLGRGEVIRGWDIGVEGMREGGKRKITIPAKFAYGNSGAPPLIPPNAPLEFEVTLVNVK